MVVDNTQKTSNAIFSTTTKVKEKNTSADEFQATLNEVKNKEEKEEEKTSSSKFTNEDIDLGAVREDFRSYAWQKMREDQYKKNEETLLNKLFATYNWRRKCHKQYKGLIYKSKLKLHKREFQ